MSGADENRRGRGLWAVLPIVMLGAGCGPGGRELGAGEGGTGCVSDRECRDGDPCNGEEWCDDGTCRAGELPAVRTACEHASGGGVCRAGICVPAGCGDRAAGAGEECDDGNLDPADGCDNACRFLCHDDADCPGGAPCTVARCEPLGAGRACRSGPAPEGSSCDDGDPCTVDDVCAGGACAGPAMDCDDGNSCTRDTCDRLREPDPGCVSEPLPLWYPDEDGDGWGTGTEGVCAAVGPARHVDRTGDCCDSSAAVFPGRTGFFDAAYACGSAGPSSFDYDCSGGEEHESDAPASECDEPWAVPSCDYEPDGWCSDAALHPSCVGVPGCGESGVWQTCVHESWTWAYGACEAGSGDADGGGPDAGDDVAGESGTADAGSGDGDSMDAGTGDGSGVAEVLVDAGATKETPSMHECCDPAFEVRVQRCR
ncbi:MAG: hypothetical protein HY907_15800 [Deltaproteobacteria bacterium]|nr:hypothetical protein [Deltaproteobacteria bacterium]